VYLLDLLQTLCDLAGIAAPATAEGISFAPVLHGETDEVRDVLFGAYAGGTRPGMRSVRRGRWKLIEYDVLDGQVRETQLFDLATNPHELLAEHDAPAVAARTGHRPTPEQTDLAEDPRHAAVLAEMRALLRAEMARLDDPYRLR
jgi:arylsulfatase A-like enzyme